MFIVCKRFFRLNNQICIEHLTCPHQLIQAFAMLVPEVKYLEEICKSLRTFSVLKENNLIKYNTKYLLQSCRLMWMSLLCLVLNYGVFNHPVMMP